MANYLLDNDDLLFYLDKGIDWEPASIEAHRARLSPTRTGRQSTAKEALEIYTATSSEMVGKFSRRRDCPARRRRSTARACTSGGRR